MTAGQIAAVQRRDRVDLERLVMRENRQKDERQLSEAGVELPLPKRSSRAASGESGRLWAWLQKVFSLFG